jgi:hypothetical protein
MLNVVAVRAISPEWFDEHAPIADASHARPAHRHWTGEKNLRVKVPSTVGVQKVECHHFTSVPHLVQVSPRKTPPWLQGMGNA